MKSLRPPKRRHLLGMLLVLVGVVASFFLADPRHPDTYLKPWAHHFSGEINTVFLVLGIGSLLFVAWRNRDRALAVRTVATVGAETGLYLAAKGLTWFGFHVLSRPSGTDGGFPSGHTACAVVVAWLLSERFGAKGAPVFYAVASVIAWSRVADGAHYPYQILAGAVLGFGVAAVLGVAPPALSEPEPRPHSAPIR